MEEEKLREVDENPETRKKGQMRVEVKRRLYRIKKNIGNTSREGDKGG